MFAVPQMLVRHVTYPLHEALLRRPTSARVRELALLMLGAPADVAAAQSVALRHALEHAALLPFYARRFAEAGVELSGDDDPAALLAKLPPLTKAEIRASEAEMLDRGVRGGLLPSSSGGTSGDKLHFYTDRRSQADALAARCFFQALLDVPPGARRMYVWGSPIESRGGRVRRWRDALLNERLINAFAMSPADRVRHLAAIEYYRPQLIYAYPTAMDLLATTARERGRPRDFRFLRAIVLTGEEVTAAQRDRITDAFDTRVVAEYGSREAGLLAHDCRRGKLHVAAPCAWLTVQSQRGAGLEGAGPVLVTPLLRRAQPLLNYALGDVVRLPAGECECGLPLPVMEVVGGKITGFIALPDGRLCHGAVTSHVLRDEPGIVAFRTIQHEYERFEVVLEVDRAYDPAAAGRIAERYRALFGPRVETDVRVVAEVPPDPSGKRRYVISHVAEAACATDGVNGEAVAAESEAPAAIPHAERVKVSAT